VNDSIFEKLNTKEGRKGFEDICLEEFASSKNVYMGGIGTLGEKRMHRVIKRAVAPSECHEIPLLDALASDGIEIKGKRTKIVADAFVDGEILEAQTGGFRPLRAKLEWIFKNTPYDVTVIHPIYTERSVCWIDTQTGEVSKPSKGRRRQTCRSIAGDMYWIRDFLQDETVCARFRVVLLYLDVYEFRNRDGWSRDGKRGSSKNEIIPRHLNDVKILSGKDSFADNFLDIAPEQFTAKEYAKISGVKGMDTYSILHVLEELGYLEENGKIDRSVIWKKK